MGVQSIHPADPTFDWLMIYRYYLLHNTAQRRDNANNTKLKQLYKNLMNGVTPSFDGEDPDRGLQLTYPFCGVNGRTSAV